MKQIRYYMLAALATMMLVGCTEDNNMDAIPQPVPAGIPETDEVIKALSDIPGVTNVRLVDEENTDDYSGAGETESLEANRRAGETAYVPSYTFSFEQPIDHNNPELGTYLQACRLRYKGAEKNVVVLTHGYNMEYYDTDLATQLDANQLSIEHRYFGQSLPEAFDNVDMTYLNSNQQARDIHNIVSTLKKYLFKTGKWASTGTSKDGITTALQAYWSDYYKWTDFDVYVPFCAPFLTGTDYIDGTHSCNDISTGTYLKDVCGYGYDDSKMVIAYKRLREIPQLICTNAKIRAAANKAVYQADPGSYQKILEQYNAKSPMSTGDQTKDVTAFTLYTYYNALFSKFSYVQFYTWADIVPDLKPLEDGTATEDQWNFFMQFIVMDDKALDKYLADQQKKKTSQAMRRGLTKEEEQWDFLRFRRESPRAPYNIQAFTELGSADNDYSIVNTTGYLKADDCLKVNYMFSTQGLYEQCGKAGIYKQDGGYLMKDFRKWAETENTQPIIFVYAYNDPWTGGGISDEAISKNPNMLVKVVDGLATHTDVFLHREFYTKDSETTIVNALNKFLKLK